MTPPQKILRLLVRRALRAASAVYPAHQARAAASAKPAPFPWVGPPARQTARRVPQGAMIMTQTRARVAWGVPRAASATPAAHLHASVGVPLGLTPPWVLSPMPRANLAVLGATTTMAAQYALVAHLAALTPRRATRVVRRFVMQGRTLRRARTPANLSKVAQTQPAANRC